MGTNKAGRLIERCRRQGARINVDESGLTVQGVQSAALLRELMANRDEVEQALLAPQSGVMARLRRLLGCG